MPCKHEIRPPPVFMESLENRCLLSSGTLSSMSTLSVATKAAVVVTPAAVVTIRGQYSGSWAIHPYLSIPFGLTISQKGTKLHARFANGFGTDYFVLVGKISGKKFSLSYTNTAGGMGASMIIRVSGTISGHKISGTASVSTGLTTVSGKFGGKKV